VGSAMNMNSFSLYNRSGFIPRGMYHDMVITVSDDMLKLYAPGEDRVRDALIKDVAGMGNLELEVSGIKREIDYHYAIKNPRVLHASVYENAQGSIDGFMISVKHPLSICLGHVLRAPRKLHLL
jgi:hypothetical protein